MYIPDQFKEDDSENITSFVRSNPFGALISINNGDLLISHLPFLYVSSNGEHGKLIGHMSKENEQWKQLITGRPVTVVFSGPHGYISPTYYSSPGVPTWNYAVVHFKGSPIIKNEPAEIIEILKQTTEYFESKETGLWKFNIPENKKNLLLNMIGGFEIVISNIECKFKLSQNRPQVDQLNIINKLETSTNYNEVQLSNFMKQYYEKKC